MLSSEEIARYQRHLSLEQIGEEGQLKLKNARVLVIGAGGLGCPALLYLSAAGVGTIGVMDDDRVDWSNLQRQVLYKEKNVGEYKAIAAIENLRERNSGVSFVPMVDRLSPENALEHFQHYDIIIDGSDNFATRYLVNDAAVLSNKPVVFASIFKFEGQVSVFNYQGGPTYRCLYPHAPAQGEMPNCSEVGVLGVLPGIVGSLQANEVLKIICGHGEVLSGKLLTFDALSMQTRMLRFRRNPAITITALKDTYVLHCSTESEINSLSWAEVQERLDQFHVIDVRSAIERQGGHIGGMHIPLDQLLENSSQLPSEKPLLIYCQSGNRSKKAILALQDQNFPQALYDLQGGYGALVGG